MPLNLFGKKGNKGVDYKSRLEHKLYLVGKNEEHYVNDEQMYLEHWMTCKQFHLQARENPEPVFDLSDCGLKTVPSGIYSLCKVFRKEALYLQVIAGLNLKSYFLD
jgi:hypothetical protein